MKKKSNNWLFILLGGGLILWLIRSQTNNSNAGGNSLAIGGNVGAGRTPGWLGGLQGLVDLIGTKKTTYPSPIATPSIGVQTPALGGNIFGASDIFTPPGGSEYGDPFYDNYFTFT